MRVVLRLLLLLLLGSGTVGALAAGWYVLLGRQPGPTYRTAAAEKGNLLATISATGTIEPEEVIDVGAQVAAQIKNFGQDPTDSSKTIDYGSVVHEKTLLAQLDDGLFKARVEQMEAALEVAQAQIDSADANLKRAEADLIQMKAKLVQSDRDYHRAQRLIDKGALADVDFDTAKATYETATSNVGVDVAAIAQARAAKVQAEKAKRQAEANLAEAKVNLGYTQIRSPVEGVIVDRRVNVGQTVVAGLNAPSLFLIAKDLKRLQVWASVNEADIGSIHPGQGVRFSVDTFPRETFRGTVAQIRLNATMTSNVVTYTVVIATDNSDGRLLPYLTANVQFEIDEKHKVLVVPNAALRWKPKPTQIEPELRSTIKSVAGKPGAKDSHDRAVIWVVDNDDDPYVRPVTVRTGLSDGVHTEIV